MKEEQLMQMDRIWHDIFRHSLKTFGGGKFPLARMGLYDISVLHRINQKEQVPIKEICMELGIAKSTMTGILKRFEAAGCIVRATDGQDRRSACLSLTDSGRALLQQHKTYEDDAYRHILEGLTDREADTLIRLLKKGCHIEA